MKYPTFNEAEEQLRDFFRSNGWPTNLIWIRPGDVAILEKKFILHPSTEGQSYAEAVYAKGIQQTHGVQLQAICCDDNHSYCAVLVPSDATEAEYALMSEGLKLSIPAELRKAKIVRGRLRWWWLRCKATPWRLM